MRIFIFWGIIAISAGYFAWTLANPPAGTPGQAGGSLWSDIAGNVGIKISAPTSALDVNGTTTIRKSLDMQANRIMNVAAPIASLDVANKAYADAAQASVSSSSAIVWGQGRAGATITLSNACGNTAECYKDMDADASCTANDIKISRSRKLATWGNAGAVCPAGWWVCSASDRDVNGASAGYGACGTGTRTRVECNMRQNPTPTYTDDLATHATSTGTAVQWSWLANAGASDNMQYGALVDAPGTLYSETATCDWLTVWCCAYQ